MSEQAWNDIIEKEITMSDYELKRNDIKFREVMQSIFSDHLNSMPSDAMDYEHLQNILNLIKSCQWRAIGPYVEKVNETHFRELIQTLMKRTQQRLYKKLLMDCIAYKITMLDPWEEYHNLLEEPLRKVFKLLDDKRFDEVDTCIDSVNFFRDEVEDHKRRARV